VKVISLPTNVGPGFARNAGWEAASFPWLAFLDSDDIWMPKKLEVQWNWILKNPDVDLCGHLSVLFNTKLNEPITDNFNSSKLNLGKMLLSNRLSTRTVMLRRDIPFRFEGRSFTEDYLLWLQIIEAGFNGFKLNVILAYSFRPEFSPGGYSGHLWTHEKRELSSLFFLYKKSNISFLIWLFFSLLSLIKFVRRVIIIIFLK